MLNWRAISNSNGPFNWLYVYKEEGDEQSGWPNSQTCLYWMYWMLQCMYSKFLGFVINTTASHLGLHLFLPKSSMAVGIYTEHSMCKPFCMDSNSKVDWQGETIRIQQPKSNLSQNRPQAEVELVQQRAVLGHVIPVDVEILSDTSLPI